MKEEEAEVEAMYEKEVPLYLACGVRDRLREAARLLTFAEWSAMWWEAR